MKLNLVFILLLFNVMLMGLEIQTGINYDLMGKHTQFFDDETDSYDVENGMSPYLQIVKHINKAKLGIGAEYQFPRTVKRSYPNAKDSNPRISQVSLLPVYVCVQVPFNSEGTILEGIVEAGYAFNLDQDEYPVLVLEGSDKLIEYHSKKATVNGGYHAGIGFAIRVHQIAFQMMYQNEQGFIDSETKAHDYLENSHVSLGIRCDLNLSPVK